MGLEGSLERAQPVAVYTRQDVLRMLRVEEKQLRAWERASLIAHSETYSFKDLGQLRKLRDLCAMHLSSSKIFASVEAMRRVSGVADPLLEAVAVCNGSRLAFRHSGKMMEPVAHQFVFDFAGSRRPQQSIAPAAASPNRDAHLNALFLEAVRLEGLGRPIEAAAIYDEMLAEDPRHAPACINLGTIFYHQRKFNAAEELYRRATEADPGYALAFFDLGNALDELRRLPEAIEAYGAAIALAPSYADAHYNLALAFERTGDRRKALRHWTAYVKLDSIGPWANHARGQARKILDREKLAIVHRSPGGGAARPTRSVAHLRLAAPTAV
jgi:tetratricopeptide (TPR) repeat protein